MAFLGGLITGGEGALVQVVIALSILVFGHIAVKIIDLLAKRFWIRERDNLTKKEVQDRHEILKYISYGLDGLVIIFTLLYLNTGLTSQLSTNIVNYLPDILSALLIGLLGFILINLTTELGSRFLTTAGARSYFQEIGLSRSAVKLMAGLFKGFLYLMLLQIALEQLGIGDTFVNELVTASSWAAAFLIAGLLFYGFKDLVQNYAAGIYLKNSRQVRPGEKVRIDDEEAEIRDVSLFSTNLDNNKGRTLVAPNKKIMESELAFRRTKSDLETLEEIKNYFIAEERDYCDAASVEMALEVFGYRTTQEDIAEKIGENADSESIVQAVKEFTNEDVKGDFVEEEKITDLASEFKTWFNDGALVLINANKAELFPEEGMSHHLLAVGVEEDEILVIDPSAEKGGVYYVNQDKMLKALNKVEQEKGYTVLAPKGTTAHWRIKNELIYSDKNYYDELSKTLESRLTKIMRQGRIMKETMPSPVKKYLEKWRSQGDVTRLWSPSEEEE